MKRIAVAMSGGVDSSVAAALSVESGAEVVGVTALLLDGSDASSASVRDAQRVCEVLGVDHHVIDLRDTFAEAVVSAAAREYGRGRTPNPCVVCNRIVKFGALASWAEASGFDVLATGHYARIAQFRGRLTIARAADRAKDQSYFLFRLLDADLDRISFPLGDLRKEDVRAVAAGLGLHVADTPESQDTCFSGEVLEQALRRLAPDALRPGPIVAEDGALVGRHTGFGRFTIGQRKGLGIGGSPEPMFVTAIDPQTRTVTLGPRSSLAVSQVTASDVVWLADDIDAVSAVVRYRMAPIPSTVHRDDERLRIRFDEPCEGVAAGQAVVCYVDDVVVGGGTIECAA